MIKAIIIDDIQIHREDLTNILHSHLSEMIQLVGEAEAITTGIHLINLVKPDLVFLDVELPPEGTAFDLLETLGPDNINFGIIFTTMYQSYAIRAFDFSALHYLLKPIDPDKLVQIIQKSELQLVPQKPQLQIAGNRFTEPDNQNKRIILRSNKGDPFEVDCKNIIRIVADEDYCRYYLINSRHPVVLATNPLGDETNKLSVYPFFFRSHKSFLINFYHVKSWNTHGVTGTVILTDDSTAEISKRKLPEFKIQYEQFLKNKDR
ncbi:MAG: LytTR family DNA-binding domain-containing protein [Bacteroidota bacterium]